MLCLLITIYGQPYVVIPRHSQEYVPMDNNCNAAPIANIMNFVMTQPVH